MSDCLDIITDFLLMQYEYYDFNKKQKKLYQDILKKIDELRKEVYLNE